METLGDMMKRYEKAHRREVEADSYLLLRLDGKAFHSYTKGLEKPYDRLLVEAMNRTAISLCEQIQGVRLGYVESDEISLLITGWKNQPVSDSNPSGVQHGQLWMGGTEAKILSLSSSIATAEFNDIRRRQVEETGMADIHRGLALFDSRLWTFPADAEGLELVKKYFMWRRRDSIKNSVTMAAHKVFGHSAIHKLNTDQKRDMLREAGEPWEELPDGFKFGRTLTRGTRVETVKYTHSRTGEVKSTEAVRSFWEAKPFSEFRDFEWDIPVKP